MMNRVNEADLYAAMVQGVELRARLTVEASEAFEAGDMERVEQVRDEWFQSRADDEKMPA